MHVHVRVATNISEDNFVESVISRHGFQGRNSGLQVYVTSIFTRCAISLAHPRVFIFFSEEYFPCRNDCEDKIACGVFRKIIHRDQKDLHREKSHLTMKQKPGFLKPKICSIFFFQNKNLFLKVDSGGKMSTSGDNMPKTI